MIVVKQSLFPVASRWRYHYYYIQTNRSVIYRWRYDPALILIYGAVQVRM